MEPQCVLVMVNTLVDSVPAKVSRMENIKAEEADEIGVLKEETEVKVEKVGSEINFLSYEARCLKRIRDAEDLDDKIFKRDGEIDIAPTTPISDREMLELLPSSEICEEDLASGCQTPTESIFDPFAPGPEELLFAPKKMMKIRDGLFSRQLNFDLYGPGDLCSQVAN